MTIFNTVYKSFKASRLPSEYQEVEYIQSSWTQKISTGYTTNNNIRIVTKFMCNWNSVNVVFGTSLSSWNWNSCLCFLNSSVIEVWASTSVSFSATTWTDYEMDYTLSSITVNWTTQTLSATTGSYELTLFYWNTNWWKTRIYSFEIYTWTTLERDFVPCYRKLDSVIWMYDLVNDVFYTNSWSWTFTKWPDVN